MASLIRPSRLTRQPQGLVRVAQANPLARGLSGYWTPTSSTAKPISGATKRATPQGIGFTTVSSTDYWLASSTAVASNNATWTILVVLCGTSTNNPAGGVAFYAERPNNTQIVKLGMGDGGTNTPVLVIRDAANNLMLLRGNTDVRTDNGKPRVIVGTRRATNDHRIFVNGVQDASNSLNIAGTFAATNAVIGNDIWDSASFLAGASLPLVLVWNRALSDAEIAQVSANPWQPLDAGSSSSAYMAAIASAATSAPVGNAYALPAAQGSYTITGNAAGLRVARRLAAGAGAYSLTGNAAVLGVARRLIAAPGAYSITGNPANLVKGSAPRVLQAVGGSYVITGKPAALRVARRLQAAPGAYAITGFAVADRVVPVVTISVRFDVLPRSFNLKTIHFSN